MGLPRAGARRLARPHRQARRLNAAAGAGASAPIPATAFKQRAAELRAQAKAGKSRAAGEKAVREAIDAMSGTDRELAEGFLRIVADVAPHLLPKTWYGFPAYTDADGKIVVFFKPAAKFESRYATVGFEEAARLDDGDMWVTSFALTALTDATEKRLREHILRAAGSRS